MPKQSNIGFKQCRTCKFTRQISLFRRHSQYPDGHETECVYCQGVYRPRRKRSTTGRLIVAALLLLAFCPAFAAAQDLPPEKLDEAYVRHQVLMSSREPKLRGYAIVWLHLGFGTVDFTDANRPTVWRLEDEGGEPYKYTWFRIRNESNGALDDYWFCERATWDQYALSGDVGALRAASWHFRHFNVSSSYEIPEFVDPITWEERTDVLTVGYAENSTLVVVRTQDGETWEWTVRGAKGVSAWQSAGSREQAKAAAQAFFEGEGVSP